jgi:alpha-L-fucosidase 2
MNVYYNYWMEMKILCWKTFWFALFLTGCLLDGRMVSANDGEANVLDKLTTKQIDWERFLSRHDMHWNELTADPVEPAYDGKLRTGYYAGALMGNGLIGTNLYKLKENVYRLNVGRSDVTEVRKPYNLFNSGRLPIGYFTLQLRGNVKDEQMHLSLYNAMTEGTFTTDKGKVLFKTFVHAEKDYIVFETEAAGTEVDYVWDFVPQQAISPRCRLSGNVPAEYLNKDGLANPLPQKKVDGDVHLLVQKLVTDTTFRTVPQVYVVGWKEIKKGNKRRILATVSQEKDEAAAVASAKFIINEGAMQEASRLENSHRDWWNAFYKQAAFLSFPDTMIENFYWTQYYKFASTARPGKPVVDLQGVWPSWDTPWPAIWMNLNIQLTYSWQTKANLGCLAQPLWDALWRNRDNLRRNVTDIPGQENWYDAACLPRTATYDFHAPLDPAETVDKNEYEVGNLTWTLFYYWQYCMAYGDTQQLTERVFPLLKSAVNLFFHIRVSHNGKYGLPPTSSPEYIQTNIGPNANYDLANLRWGLQTLIDIDTTYRINDPMLPRWKDFLENLVDYPYSPETGFKVSDKYEFMNTSHRHYSHLFMIYPYHMLDWENPADCAKMELSLVRWKGNRGFSRTGKASMLLSKGDGNGALEQMLLFFQHLLGPNTLYPENGPCMETPMAAVSTLHEFYMQDWGDKIRVFFGVPSSWNDASFVNLRANGAFLISATRKAGRNTLIQVESEKGGICRLQTGMSVANLQVVDLTGKARKFTVVSELDGTIEMLMVAGEIVQVMDKSRGTGRR